MFLCFHSGFRVCALLKLNDHIQKHLRQLASFLFGLLECDLIGFKLVSTLAQGLRPLYPAPPAGEHVAFPC